MTDDGDKRSAGARFSREDRDLIRRIGSNLRRIINNELIVDMVPRQDELGILANLVNRVDKELKAAHQKEQEKQTALERKVVELSEAQERQEQLLYTIREISTPILKIHDGVLLLPIIGAMDSLRAMTGQGPILLYPVPRNVLTRPFFRVPNSQYVFLFDILRTAPPIPEVVNAMVADNRELFEEARDQGGYRYTNSSIPFTPADWVQHFGDSWDEFRKAKRQYDPNNILTPGQNIFV